MSRGNPHLLPLTVMQCKLLYISTASIIPTAKRCSTEMRSKERRKIFGVILPGRRVGSSQTPVLGGQKGRFNITWCQFLCMTENSIRRNSNSISACSTGSSGTPWSGSTAGSRMSRSAVAGGRMLQPMVLPGAHPEGWKQKWSGKGVTGCLWHR